MPIAIPVLLLIAYVYALVTQPRFRRWGLLFGAAAGLVAAVYFWRSEPETVRQANLISAEQISLDSLSLETTARGAVLTGRVTNNSPEYRLRDMTLDMRLFDCPDTATDTTGCPIIGEATAIARPDVPPGQLRGFKVSFLFYSVPPVEGTLRWDWTITGTRATN